MKGHSIIDIVERSQARHALKEENELNGLDTLRQVPITLIEDTEAKPSGSGLDGVRIFTIAIPANTQGRRRATARTGWS